MAVDEQKYKSNLNRLEDLANKAVGMGTDLGASQVEAVLTNGFERTIEISGNSITGIQQQGKTKVTVRAYIGKKMGISSATSLTDNSIEESVRNAIKLAELSPPDDNFVSLAEPIDRKPAEVKGLFDPALATLDPATVVQNVGDLIQGSTEVDERTKVNGKLNLNTTERVVANSLGISVPVQLTSMLAFSYISLPASKTDIGMGFEVLQSRKWDKDTDFYELGRIGAEKAKKMLGAQLPPTKKMPVIMDERATGQTFASRIGIGVNGYMVMNGMSYFTDKIGEELANTELNVWDDPHVEGGSGSRIFDTEGTPTTKVDLFNDGILSNYVTDSYTSNKMGLENTGNAGSGFGGKVPRPSVHQMQIGAGSDAKNAMLEDMKEGLYLESGLNAFSVTPDISAKLDRAFYVKDGEIQYAVKDTMLGTNVFEMLKGITAISKELKVEFGRQYPSIAIAEVSIAGAGEEKKSGPAITMGSI